uniref:phage tail protein n=1 Tax=Paractinoplanes polyasparticus TaxID=2856853 RepID=UPI001C85C5A9|nr:phage tail protein [Actinoplanes polyasparticus]
MSAAIVVPGSRWYGRGWLPWPTGTANDVVVAGGGLALPELPGGAPPEGFLAAGPGRLWLLDRPHVRLRRFDAVGGRFRTEPGWGADGWDDRRFGPRATIAAAGDDLAVADPDSHRVVVLNARTRTVRLRFDLGHRRPRAVAAAGNVLLLLDDRGVAYAGFRSLGRPPAALGTEWRRIAADTEGRVCLLAEDGTVVRHTGGTWEAADDAVFPDPVVPVDHAGRFRVPARFRLAGADASTRYDATGHESPVDPGEPPGPPRHPASGLWTSAPVDSRILGCRWHRLTAAGPVPPGCSIVLRTYADDLGADVPRDGWSRPHVITGPAQPRTDADSAVDADYAVLAGRGRYLRIQIELTGDGWATPVLGSLLVEPETPSLDQFLPAIYRAEEQTTGFLHRFLALFGAELDALEQRIRTLPTRFSPTSAPDRLLDELAAELGVPLERGGTAAQRRAMLAAVPRAYSRRGTPAAIRTLLRTHLEAALGRTLPEGIPALVEGFRERPSATLGHTRLPAGPGLWSDSVVDRPRLGNPGRHDRITLVSVGDAITDRFRVHAHRFRVVVPRPLLADAEARERFERLVEAEKPAHVGHELTLIDPRAVVGVQGVLGVDTYLGDRPPARLAAPGDPGPPLGAGLRLDTGRSRPPAVGRGARAGGHTVLI